MHGSENNPAPLAQEHLHLTPIFTSRLIQFFLILFLLVALLNHQRDFTLFILLILGIAFGAKLWSGLSLAHIKTSTTIDRQKLFPDEPVRMDLHVENAKWLPVWFRVELSAGTLDHEADDGPMPRECGLLWHQNVSFAWTLKPQKRGVYAVGPPRITVGDLMGFYPRAKKEREALQLVVFPRLVSLKSFSFAKRDYFGTPGSKSPVQDPVYILGTRDYQSWRPARFIHWKASSRQNRLQEKIFEPSEQAKVLLIMEVGQFELHNAEMAFENTLELVASIAVQLNRQGYALGFMTDGAVDGNSSGVVPLARNSRQLSMILEILARLKMKTARPIDDFSRKGFDIYWGTSCARFAYKSDPDDVTIIRRLKQRKIPFASFLYEVDYADQQSLRFAKESVYRIEDIRVPKDLRT
jgi:uncharacterized protein (DUF58 family)